MELIFNNRKMAEKASFAVTDGYNLGSDLKELFLGDGEISDGQFRVFHTDGLILIDIHSQFSQRAALNVSFNNSIVAMLFHLDGDARIVERGVNHDSGIKLQRGKHNFEVFNSGNLKFLIEPVLSVNSFIILLSQEFCLRIMPQAYDSQDRLVKAVKDGHRISLSPEFALMSQDMKQIIEKVRNCSRKGSFHRLCLEIKIAELLMLQLEQQANLHSEQLARPAMHDADIEKIEEAKNILEDQYIQPPTIKDLAGMVGLNETKLKTNFKKTFHSTIHAYTQRIRMQKAHELLTQKNLLLKEIAIQVGYQKPSNFTYAYKEFFGIHPGDVARNRKRREY